MYSANEYARLQRMLAWVARLVLAAAIPLAATLIFFGGTIVAFVFGTEYEEGKLALSILCVGQVCNAGLGSVNLILNMTGHERDVAIGVGVGAALNVVMNLLLIPEFGLEGAASATAMSTIAWNGFLARRVFVRTGLVSIAFMRESRLLRG